MRSLGPLEGLRLGAQVNLGIPRVITARSPNGTRYRSPNDASQWHHLAESAAKLERIVEAMPANTRTILDLGANVGLFALLALARFPKARVICVEADPALVPIAQANLADFARAEIIAAAVDATRGGQRTLYRARCSNQLASLTRGNVAAFVPDREIDTVEVPTVGIADLIGTGVDFMKVDIQGHEHAVFAGCPDLLARVGACAFEITFLDARVFELIEILRRTYNQHEVLSMVHSGADVLFRRE